MQTQEIPQHMQALKLGDKKRLARAKLKRRVRAGSLSVAKVIKDNPDCLTTTSNRCRPVTILDIMSWPKGIHRRSREAILRELRIPPYTQLHNLSPANRARLVKALR